MKPYMSPPLWVMLGFLSGWLYCRPGIVISVVWSAAYFGMLMWIMREVEAMSPDNSEG